MADHKVLSGRKFLLTGAASGIGAATARNFAAAGATLVLADLAVPAAEAIAADLGAHAVEIDVRNEGSVCAGVAKAAALLGGLDGLVNTAGVATLARLEHTSLDEWNLQIATNLTGVFLVCREAAAHLRAAESATIVNVASASGLRPSAVGAAYSASKAGVVMLSKALARELGPSVRVNAICPGMVDTPMFAKLVPKRSKAVDTTAIDAKLSADYVFRRLAQPDEIARAILFLSSAESSFITGTALAVDGGRTFH